MATKTKTIKRRTITSSNSDGESVFFACRIDRELADQFRQRARANDRTIGAELNRVLRAALAQPEKEGIGQ